MTRRVADPGRLAATLVVSALSAWLLSTILAHVAAAVGLELASDTLSVVATALFFGAGVLRYSRWTLTGEASFAIMGSALMVFAVVTFPMALVSRALGGEQHPAVWNSVARLVAALTVVAMLATALRSPTVDSTLRPRRRAVVGVAASTVSFVLLVLAHRAWAESFGGSPAFSAKVELTVGGIWVAAGAAFLLRGRRLRSPTAQWSATSLGLLGVAGVLRAGAAATSSTGWLVAAAYLMALAAVVSLLNAGADLREALSSEGDELLSTSGALADAEQLLRDVERRRQEVVHDSRSMIAALRAASRTLDRYQDTLDDGTRRRLQAAMDGELARLGRLIDARAEQPFVEFDLDDALLPVIATHQSDGLAVDADLGGLRTLGRPDDLAEALHNLLVNARQHAPGSPVTVRAETAGPRVLVLVEDRGPGVDRRIRDAVFQRGVVGDTSRAGSGLGLAAVRRLMRQQHGDADVLERPGGGARFVLWLPGGQQDRLAVGCRRPGDPVEQVVKVPEPGHLVGHLRAVDQHPPRTAVLAGELDDNAGTGRG
ncbi:MAG: sensor histidine kinase [Actinomycetes bacterium]